MTKEEKIMKLSKLLTTYDYDSMILTKRGFFIEAVMQLFEGETTSLKAEVESLKSQLAKAEADKQELLDMLKEFSKQYKDDLAEGLLLTLIGEYFMNKTNELINKHGNNK